MVLGETGLCLARTDGATGIPRVSPGSLTVPWGER